jgi:hypothetical protein
MEHHKTDNTQEDQVDDSIVGESVRNIQRNFHKVTLAKELFQKTK